MKQDQGGLDGPDVRAVKALSHPLRARILQHLRRHERASPNELAVLWDVSLGVVSYHVRRLRSLGFVRVVERTPRRGVVEHHYALADDARRWLRHAAESVLSYAEPAATRASAVLDEIAIAALRSDLQRLVARMKELEAQTITRASAADEPSDGLPVELLLVVEQGRDAAEVD